MKRFLYLFAWVAIGLLAACSSSKKEKADDLQVLTQDSLDAKGPQRMQVSDIKTPIDYRGKKYVSVVKRQPDESLPLVVNEQGEKFVDNRIRLRLTCGERTVLDKEFTKETFASLVDAKFLKNSILEGLVFDQTTSRGFIYAASVCYPQTDLYIPLRITVTPDGKVSMVQEELLEDLYQDEDAQ